MSEEKQHLDEGWDDLPLPDANTAWQKMEVLLDEDKKRRRLLPFWFWRSAGFGLLLIGLVTAGWFLLWDDQTAEPTSRAEQLPSKTNKTEKQNATDPGKNGSQPNQLTETTNSTDNKTEPSKTTSSDDRKQQTQDVTTAVFPARKKTTSKQLLTNNQAAKKTKPGRVKKKEKHPDLQLLEDVLIEGKNTEEGIVSQPQKPSLTDTIAKAATVAKDSVTKKDTAFKKAAEPVAMNEDKTDSSQKKKPAFLFSAGIGLQQAIAINGQQSSNYHYNGKKGSLSDRIPSVYFRLQRGKWFVQAEFQYGVPQPVKPFSFSQKTSYDVSSLNLNKEQFSIQKLYYHQLPVSVNYFVMPNWSIGTGGMYNILAGAVTEQQINRENVLTGDMSASRNVAAVKGYKDSFLYKTTAGIIFQTDYHWKRFALGLRFTQNLQPFIKYTKPDGQIVDERNKVLQAILRFQLFKK